MLNVDADFRIEANHPQACYQWQLQRELQVRCGDQLRNWVSAVRLDSQEKGEMKELALRCFKDFVPECRKSKSTEGHQCLKREAGLAIAQLLAGENARQELSYNK